MGFLAPAVPWIIKGGAMLGGSIFGRMAQGSAQKRSPEEAAAVSGAQTAATGLGRTGTELMGQGAPLLGQAGNYWQTLLRGSRPAMAQATAGPRAALTDIYRGAESNLERSGIRGAQRDVAAAELGRDRAGQIARLTTGMQPLAAQGVSDIGRTLLGTGADMSANSASIWSDLLGEGFENRKYARGEGEKSGKAIGGLIFDILTGTLGKKFGGKPPTTVPGERSNPSPYPQFV